MSELGRTIAQGINERDSIRSEQVKQDTVANYFVLNEYRIKVAKTFFKSERREINDAFILGHSTNGILGTGAANVLGIATLGSWVTIEEDNLSEKITNISLQEVAKWINSESAVDPTHIAIGTDSTAYDETDTTLGAEVESRIAGTMDISVSKTIQIQSIFDNIGQSDVLEVGVFSASSDGIMYYRKIISDLDMVISRRYRFTFKFLLSDGSVGDTKVVDEGLNEIRDFMGGSTGTAPTHIEWNDATYTVYSLHTASSWDGDGSNEKRNANSTNTRVSNVVTFEGLLTTSEMNGTNIRKSGTFNASSNGNLFGEVLYGAIVKTSLFQISEIDRYIVTGGVGNIVLETFDYTENFIDITFKDSDTTADWDTTNGRLSMSSSSNTKTSYNTIGIFKKVIETPYTVPTATLNCTETKLNPGDVILYYLSPDDGVNWEEVSKGVEHTFVNSGNKIKARIVFIGNGASGTYIESLTITAGDAL